MPYRYPAKLLIHWVLTGKFLAVLPITFFIVYLRLGGGPEGIYFPPALTLASVLALVVVSVLSLRKVPINRLVAGVNLWLALGGASMIFGWDNILWYFIELREIGFFMVMFVVGVVSTFAFKSGYVGIPHPDRKKVMRYSLHLLLVTAVCMVISHIFKGNILLGGTLPFIALSVINWGLAVSLAGTKGTKTTIAHD